MDNVVIHFKYFENTLLSLILNDIQKIISEYYRCSLFFAVGTSNRDYKRYSSVTIKDIQNKDFIYTLNHFYNQYGALYDLNYVSNRYGKYDFSNDQNEIHLCVESETGYAIMRRDGRIITAIRRDFYIKILCWGINSDFSGSISTDYFSSKENDWVITKLFVTKGIIYPDNELIIG